MNLGEECHGAHFPSSDPSPTPRPLLQCFKGKEPQMIITPAYIQHAELMMTYTDDVSSVIEHYTSSQPLGLGIKGGRWVAGKLDRLIAPQAYEPWTT